MGINPNLEKCVTQAPVTPRLGGMRARFIDILSVDDGGDVSIVELKIDNKVATADEELTSYCTAFANRDYVAHYPYPPEVRWAEGYLPARGPGVFGGWEEHLTPRCLVVATAHSQRYTTILLRENFINHIPQIWAD